MTAHDIVTLSILTIPEREEFLRRLLASVLALKLDPLPHIDIVYNRPLQGSLAEAQELIRGFAPHVPVDVYFNAGETSIVGGRNLQLSVCRTPVVAFVDDDLTLHGDIVPALLETLASNPVGLVGFPSYDGESDKPVKPRAETPSVEWRGLRFMPVQGMVCGGYRALFADIGGFNPRRRFWGEWTEFNLRMWRCGFPTAYQMERGFLRHWETAPSSPTRNMVGREQHVLWGLICTALEYDAVDVNAATEVFWRLVEDRYLAYSYGTELSPRNVLKTVLELVPHISNEWGSIQAFRAATAAHRYQFAPFHRLSLDDVKSVCAHARTALVPYRARLAIDAARMSGSVEVQRIHAGSLRSAMARLKESFTRLRSTMSRGRASPSRARAGVL